MDENHQAAQRLRDIDAALQRRLDRMKDMVEGGDYSLAICHVRNLEDGLREANNFANRLADAE